MNIRLTRRAALSAVAGAGLGAGIAGWANSGPAHPEAGAVIPFHGEHQAGIATLPQEHLSFAAFDVADGSIARLRQLLERWSEAAAAMTAGRAFGPGDPGEAVGLPAARLTITLGFGPRLFAPGRFPALTRQRPSALEPLPSFAGDQLNPGRSGGDLCVQACADDPQVAFHAVHRLSLLARPTAQLRWTQAGFRSPVIQSGQPSLPRNLIGFIDGTSNLRTTDPAALERFVWSRSGDGPDWMIGGTYLIARRIQIQFSSWDALGLPAQEQAIGRDKLSGRKLAPVPLHAHIQQAAPAANGAQRILRRSYNYSAGRGELAGELDGGLFFIAFVRDPARQFIPLQRRLATSDALSAFTLHTGSAIFACPPGAQPGEFPGQLLFS